MNKHSTKIRLAYTLMIGFLIGLFVGVNFIDNPRQSELVSSKNKKIESQERVIEGLLNELNQEEN